MNNRTTYYKGVLPHPIIASLFIVIQGLFILYVLIVFTSLFMPLWLSMLFFFAFLWMVWANGNGKMVKIRPDGTIRIGKPYVSFQLKQKQNTYTISSFKSSNVPVFLFTLSNISDIYQTDKMEKMEKITVGLISSLNPITYYATAKDKIVCFEFKKPLENCNALGWITEKNLWGNERPLIQKVYVSVTEPTKLVRDIQFRTGISHIVR